MKDNRAMLRNIAKRALRRYSDSQKSSQISETIDSSGRFDFDAELLSSPRYERALHYLRKMESRRTELGASSSTRQHVGLGISGPGDDLSSLRSDLYTPSFLSDDTLIPTNQVSCQRRQAQTLCLAIRNQTRRRPILNI